MHTRAARWYGCPTTLLHNRRRARARARCYVYTCIMDAERRWYDGRDRECEGGAGWFRRVPGPAGDMYRGFSWLPSCSLNVGDGHI